MSFPVGVNLVTIADGQALSGKTFIGHGALVSLIIPAGWDAASITFRGSADGENFYDIYDYLGTEVELEAAASRMISIDNFAGAPWMKVRSGTAGSPVNQTGDIVLTLVVQKFPVL